MIKVEVALDENLGPVGPNKQQVGALAHEGGQQQRAVGNHHRRARFGLQDNHRAGGLRKTHTVTQDKRIPWVICGHRFPSSIQRLPRNRRAKRRQRILTSLNKFREYQLGNDACLAALEQKRPRLPQDVAESPSLARTTAQAPWLRGSGGGFTSQLRRHRERLPVTARGGSSGRGLGRVLLKWFARQASRFGYHGTRTVGIGFRLRGKVPSRVLISATGTHTEAAALLRRRGQGKGGDLARCEQAVIGLRAGLRWREHQRRFSGGLLLRRSHMRSSTPKKQLAINNPRSLMPLLRLQT